MLLIVCAAAILASLAIAAIMIATALWRLSLPDPAQIASSTDEAFVVVFFDQDVTTTVPRARVGLETAEEMGIDIVFLVGGARAWRNYHGSVELANQLNMHARHAGISLVADQKSYDTVTNLEQVVAFRSQRFPSAAAVLVSDDYHLMRISWLIGRGVIPRDGVAFIATSEERTLLDHLYRAVWEVGAWISLTMPDTLREHLLASTRR